MLTPLHLVQDAVKGSQGAGKVDETLDRTKMDIDADGSEAPSNAPKLPSGSRKKKGRR